MSRLTAWLLLGLIGLSVAGCIVEPAPAYGPGYDRWCYYHPYRCGR